MTDRQLKDGRRAEPMKTRQRSDGFTTIETVIVIALFGIVLISLVGLHLVALSAGTAAETSTIAANLARARMEELLALPPDTLKDQNNAEARRQIPADGGRTYTVHTTVESPDPARLDLTVTVTWQLARAGACAAGPGTNCAGNPVTYSRTLQTRVAAPVQP
jgi:Tfp pilus assembly protein PilV